MKKVLSVAMASAMVLGMGANAFAITYNTSTNDEADWPEDFQFDGALFVTDKDGDIVTDATTAINDNETVDFQPGDVIWMPLYADDQLIYDAGWSEAVDGEEAVSNVKVGNYNVEAPVDLLYEVLDGKATWWQKDAGGTYTVPADIDELKEAGYAIPSVSNISTTEDSRTEFAGVKSTRVVSVSDVPAEGSTITYDEVKRTVAKNSTKYSINGTKYKTLDELNAAIAAGNYTEQQVNVTVNLEEIDDTDESIGKPVVDEENSTRAYSNYTGNIDKNWSINLIEGSTGVAELIENAELYKATAVDYASYSKYTDEIMPNAVYLKITLKDEFKTVTTETLKYYVYVTDNTTGDKTNEVWVSGTYSNKSEVKTVDFTWTNDASQPAIWKVADNESGVAVFDFADKAFFSVKMYSGETMYLDLSTAYDAAMAGDFNEAEAFFAFDNDNANFSRTGTLILVSDDSSLIPYQVTEDGYVKVDAEYVEDYAIAHTNEKVDGFVFETKELGNYVLATDELEVEEDNTDNTEEVVVPDTDDNTTTETSKPNPSTGAEDFVGLAVSLAVVSVAAAGALALKK